LAGFPTPPAGEDDVRDDSRRYVALGKICRSIRDGGFAWFGKRLTFQLNEKRPMKLYAPIRLNAPDSPDKAINMRALHDRVKPLSRLQPNQQTSYH
jgi:hypothetical protein